MISAIWFVSIGNPVLSCETNGDTNKKWASGPTPQRGPPDFLPADLWDFYRHI